MASSFGSFLFGTPGKVQQLSTVNPNQMSAMNQLLSRGLAGLDNPQAGFQPIADQARRQFQTQGIPSLAERFTSLGGGQRSSAFQGALGSAQSDLESQLAALGSQYGQRQQDFFSSLLGMGLQPTFENILRPRQPGFFEGLSGSIGEGAGQSIPLLLKYLLGGAL